MLDSKQRRRIKYEDVLRAVGHYLDRNQIVQVGLFELPQGFLVKAYGVMESRRGGIAKAYHTFMLTDADIDALLQESYGRQQTPNQPAKKSLWRRG